MIIWLLFLTGNCAPVLVTSDSTPEALKGYFSSYHELKIVSSNVSLAIQALETFEVGIIIDTTLQPHLFSLLDSLSEYFSTFYLTISPVSKSSYSSYRFYSHGSPESLADALKRVALNLNWNNFVTLYSTTMEDMQIASILNKEFASKNTTQLSFDSSISEANANTLILKMIKNKGESNLAIMAYGSSLKNIQKAIIANKMLVAGNTFLLPSKAIWSASMIGSMIVVEKGLEFANSWEEYEYLSIINSLKKFQLKSSPPKGNILNTEYSLVNVQSKSRVIVGSIENSLIINGTCIYPGNTTVLNVQLVKPIVISIANGTMIIDASDISNSQFQHWYLGAIYAAQVSNDNQEIPSFKIVLKPTGCDNKELPLAWFLACLKNQTDLGIAYLSGYSGLSSVYNLYALRAYKRYIPQISPMMATDITNNRTIFPEFLKMTVSFDNYCANIGHILMLFGFKHVAIMTTNDTFYLAAYDIIVKQLEARGLVIANPPESRFFYPNYTSAQFETYKDSFMAVKNSRVRALVTLGAYTGYFMEGLYDVGLRKGDMILFGPALIQYWITDSNITQQQLMKRYEMFSGAFSVTYYEFSGLNGDLIESSMAKLYGDTTNLCFSYDAFLLYKEAIKHAINSGLDFEDPNVLLRIIRLNRLSGCFGNVYFDRESNSRSQAKLLLAELIIDVEAQKVNVLKIASLDMLSAKSIDFISNPYWYGETSTLPDEFRPISRCQFDDYQIQDSDNGKMVLYIIACCFLLYTVLASIYFYRISDDQFIMLEVKAQISSEDMYALVFFVFEPLQILAMGPDQEMYINIIQSFQNLISLDFNLYFKIENEQYWLLLNTVLCTTGLLIIITIFVILRVNTMKLIICQKINGFFMVYSPIVAHLAYLPMISVMLSVFMCEKGISDDLYDSYSKQDCSVFCYQGKHANYAAASIILLTLFIPLAVYCRFYLEISSVSLHIKTKPLYILFLSTFQVILIVLNKCIKSYSQVIHGFIMSAVIIIFTALSIRLKPYGYMRANIFQYTSLSIALWGVICSTFNQFTGSLIAWTIIEFSGFGIILLVGLLISSRLPNLLYSQKGNAIAILFLFQCIKKYEDFVIKHHDELIRTNRLSIYRID